jgi:hypothetical protein
VQEVPIHDRNRNPPNWTDLIQPTQYAAFLSDADSGAEMTSDGRVLDAGMIRCCLIFDSLAEVEQYCRQKVEQIPTLRCDIFDSHGRANPPVASLVNAGREHKLDSPKKAQRMMRWGLICMAASLPLFWITWARRGEAWIAAFFGVQLAFFGLRLLQWGYGMKEELRNRASQSEQRAQQNATSNLARRP